MGEGGTSPIGGAETVSSSAECPRTDGIAPYLQVLLLLTLSCVVALKWTSLRRRKRSPDVGQSRELGDDLSRLQHVSPGSDDDDGESRTGSDDGHDLRPAAVTRGCDRQLALSCGSAAVIGDRDRQLDVDYCDSQSGVDPEPHVNLFCDVQPARWDVQSGVNIVVGDQLAEDLTRDLCCGDNDQSRNCDPQFSVNQNSDPRFAVIRSHDPQFCGQRTKSYFRVCDNFECSVNFARGYNFPSNCVCDQSSKSSEFESLFDFYGDYQICENSNCVKDKCSASKSKKSQPFSATQGESFHASFSGCCDDQLKNSLNPHLFNKHNLICVNNAGARVKNLNYLEQYTFADNVINRENKHLSRYIKHKTFNNRNEVVRDLKIDFSNLYYSQPIEQLYFTQNIYIDSVLPSDLLTQLTKSNWNKEYVFILSKSGNQTKNIFAATLTSNSLIQALNYLLQLDDQNSPHHQHPATTFKIKLIKCKPNYIKSIMESSGNINPDAPGDSFFTWDSGGGSGEYSFVHTAVELPKYPDGAITEEERQMLLLYMRSGHPELLLPNSSTGGSADHQIQMTIQDGILCDPASARGFLETIVEENSDDLRSPSEADETSLGWGSWDESDDDRVTVVEMKTQDAGPRREQGHKRNRSDSFDMPSATRLRKESVGSETDDMSLSSLSSFDVDFNHVDENRNDSAASCASESGVSQDMVKLNSLNCEANALDDQCSQVSDVSDLFPVPNDNFEALWISATKIDSPLESINPWCRIGNYDSMNDIDRGSMPNNVGFRELDSMMFLNDSSDINEVGLIAVSDNQARLAPSLDENIEFKKEESTFSDDFKDYFLPAEIYVPNFSGRLDSDSVDDDAQNAATEPFPASSRSRCYSIGFETGLPPNDEPNLEIEFKGNLTEEEVEIRGNSDGEGGVATKQKEAQETVFSPREGDVVYGSSWFDNPAVLKEQEKPISRAETITMQPEACRTTMATESPPPDNNRRSNASVDQSASDDDLEVPASLSRWQHHTDLQRVQEATSPLTRWQHQLHLPSADDDDDFQISDEDNGLPPQLKQIYSSFKMKDKKMGRIRIKEDKNNNFKTIGLWDNETKVTLPPFNGPVDVRNGTSSVDKEDLDDLELEMFAVGMNGKESAARQNRLSSNSENEIDNALNSFNHLDEYSSNSDSEEQLSSFAIASDNPLEDNKLNHYFDAAEQNQKVENGHESENAGSDNSDNCPLCTDSSFNGSDVLFSKAMTEDVKTLLLNTYPKVINDNTVSNAIAEQITDSLSPIITSSDSDEGIIAAKELKKRAKKRPKDNTNIELKHDDSGYVEDDEDDDEDDILDEKGQINLNTNPIEKETTKPSQIRKSLTSEFYNSKSNVTEQNPSIIAKCSISQDLEEFSSHLDRSMDLPLSNLKPCSDKWSIPENLSQFSAWLLDKELKKINSRDHMEALIMNDLVKLREQTITQFLHNTSVNPDSLKLPDVLESSKHFEPVPEDSISSMLKPNGSKSEHQHNKHADISNELNGSKTTDLVVSLNNCLEDPEIVTTEDPPLNSEIKTFLPNFDLSEESTGDENDSYEKQNISAEELEDEYYNYNYNSNVSKVFEDDVLKQDILKQLQHKKSLIKKIEVAISGNDNETATNESNLVNHGVSTVNLDAELKPQSIVNERSGHENAETIVESPASDAPSLSNDHRGLLKDNTNVISTSKIDLHAVEVDSDVAIPVPDSVNLENMTCSERSSDENNSRDSAASDGDLISDETTSVDLESLSQPSISTEAATGADDIDVREVAPSVEPGVNKPKADTGSGMPSDDLMTLGILAEEGGVRVESPSDESVSSPLSGVGCEEGETHVREAADVVELVAASLADSECNSRTFSGSVTERRDSPLSESPCHLSESVIREADFNSSCAAVLQRPVESSQVQPDLVDVTTQNSTCEETLCATKEDVFLLSQGGVADDTDSDVAASKCVISLDESHKGNNLFDANDRVEELINVSSQNDSLVKDTFDGVSDESGKIENVNIVYGINSGTNSESICHSENLINFPKPDLISSCLKSDSKVNDTKIELQTTVDKAEKLNGTTPCIDSINKTICTDVIAQKVNISIENVAKDFKALDNLPLYQIDSPSLFTSSANTLVALQPQTDHKRSHSLSRDSVQFEKPEYQRSRSVGPDSKTTEEDCWSNQSKSTPDLRRCIENHPFGASSAPLSVLLSKSVSQRIQDYLGSKARGEFLNRSLPPHERSRHYRRICVSTETVVERAARFEARGRPDYIPSYSALSRSGGMGGVPQSPAWGSASRVYNKPTATVRPSMDTYKSAHPKPAEKDIMELVTGYSKAVLHKPPLPPVTDHNHQNFKSTCIRGRIASARKDFFEKLSSSQDLRSKAEELDHSGLQRFDHFRRSARDERARLAASHPDLGALEAAVRSSKRKIDQMKKKKRNPQEDAVPDSERMPSTSDHDLSVCLPYRRCTGEIAWASCAKRIQEAKAKRKPLAASQDVDFVTGDEDELRSYLFKRPAETTDLRAHPQRRGDPGRHRTTHHPRPRHHDESPTLDGESSAIAAEFLGTRARSMDFLLDADNRDKVLPPENKLQGRVKSEHELRIERSLQNLTIPDWYKQSAWSKKPSEGFILRRGSEGSAGESRQRWRGLGSSSRTPSATSLTPCAPVSYSASRSIVVPKRVTPTGSEWRYAGSLVSSRESLTPASPASLSPRECAAAAFQYGLNASLSRWSSSRLSTSSAPATGWSAHRSFRQPYLGWRAAAAASSGAPSSGIPSPGASPVTGTTPLHGSRPASPRRGSQEHHHAPYHSNQNQMTSAATLRPEGDTGDNSRISPLALYDNATNVFFNSNVEASQSLEQNPYANHYEQRYNPVEMRRDRYSYTQSLYSGTVLVSPGTEDDQRNYNLDHQTRIITAPLLEQDDLLLPHMVDCTTDERFSLVRSPQPPPRVWMESSFVGTKKNGEAQPYAHCGRSIRIVPSDASKYTNSNAPAPSSSSLSSGVPSRGASSGAGPTCATQTTMETRELIDHLHNFLRGLQSRDQLIQPSSNSAFMPVSSSSTTNSGFHQQQTPVQNGQTRTSSNQNLDDVENQVLVDYDSEPKAYPRSSWRHSSSSSKDMSPENSSTDNELWMSVREDFGQHGKVFARVHPEPGEGSSRSSVSPPSPPQRYQQQQKRVSEDSTGSRPIFFASSRRGSKGSNETKSESTSQYVTTSSQVAYQSQQSHYQDQEDSRKSSSTEESGYNRRDSKSGSGSLRDSRTTPDTSTTSRDKDSKSSASMEEVLDSLLAIPMSNSRSSSPTSPRRSKGPA